MTHIPGSDRTQGTFLPAVLDDYVTADNPVRVIDEYVITLDLVTLGFRHAKLQSTGRPPYDPADLLKLYIYGYLNRIRSSRQLEKATTRTVDLMWLLKKLTPDFKTISDFRKDNAVPLQKVFREFTLLCKDMNLFSAEIIAIDGSKFSASNHNSQTYTRTSLAKTRAEIDAKIRVYTKALDRTDEHERISGLQEAASGTLSERIARLEEHKAQLDALEQRMHRSGETQVSLTDPDSRKMKTGHKGNDCCYNVQMSVDSKHKLIVDIDPTSDCNDEQQLYRMAKRAKEILQVDSLTVVADTGYYKEQDIYNCDQEQITCYVPEQAKSQNKRLGLYTDKDFQYDLTTDSYKCPAGEHLHHVGSTIKSGKPTRYYGTKACKQCSLRSQCTRSKGNGRRIFRWEHEPLIERMTEGLNQSPDKMFIRKCLVEHPFGTIKHALQCHSFLVRGREKVRAETCLFALSYNLQRILNILGVEPFFKRLLALPKSALLYLNLVRLCMRLRAIIANPRCATSSYS